MQPEPGPSGRDGTGPEGGGSFCLPAVCSKQVHVPGDARAQVSSSGWVAAQKRDLVTDWVGVWPGRVRDHPRGSWPRLLEVTAPHDEEGEE